MPHTQVLRNSGERLQVTFTVDGVATDPDGNAATVAVTKADGSVLVASTAATKLATGVYTYSLQPQADLNRLTATWTGTFGGIVQSVTTTVEIVGGYYCSLAELRAEPNLSDTTKFTTAKLIAARQWFEEKFERYTGRAFVARYRRLTVWGRGTDTLMLPDHHISRLVSVSFGTVSLGTQALANTVVTADGRLQRYWPYLSNATDTSWGVYGQVFPANTRVTLEYEYGLEPSPDDVHDAAIIAIRDKLLNDQTGRPMLSIADGAGGTTRYAMPGPNRPFGIPDVDVIANDRQRGDRQRDRLTVGTVPLA